MSSAPRLRFAPAPSGYLHVGGAWMALFNWIVARQSGGTLLLRFEDTDPATARAEMTEPMLESLRWLGIDFDEGPYHQSERGELYRKAMEQLLATGAAYLVDAEDRPVEGDQWTEGHAVRFRVPEEGATTFTDVIRGELSFANAGIEDFVVWRSRGGPTFYLANAVDDVDMAITHVIRGEDLLSSTPRVLLCRQALGTAEPPVYAHLPVLVDENRKKLSKRKGEVAVADYRHKGYLPEAMVNYLATLGWGPPDGVEIRPMDEILELFRLEDVNPSPAFFDVKKLTHFNAEWIRRLSVDEFIGAAGRFLEAGPWAPGDFDFGAFEVMAPLVQERVTTLSEVPGMVDFLFLPDAPVDEDSWEKAIGRNEAARSILEGVLAGYSGVPWDAASLKAVLERVGEEHGMKLGKAQAPVRVAVTGRTVGPPLFESLEVLGRDETLRRLRDALGRIR